MLLTVSSNSHATVKHFRAVSHICGTHSRLCTTSWLPGRPAFAQPVHRHTRLIRKRSIGEVRASVFTIAAVAQLPPMLQAILSPATVALTVLSAAAISAWASVRRKAGLSEVTADLTQFNKGVLSRCPTINAPYIPFPFLTNGHVETIFASKTRRSPPVIYDRESFKCPDGGTIHLDYHNLPTSIVGTSQCG